MLRGLKNRDGVRISRSATRARRFAARPIAVDKVAPLTLPSGDRRLRGFTLLELMIVISMIMILMAVAVPLYNQSIIQARESVLRSNLSTLRSVISQYTLDKQKAPQSLDDLVTGGYLRQIPVDPMTRQTNWEVVQEEIELAVDQQDPGITDVHSASSATASDGTAYSTW
jgi:general secretion pathway protein G